MKIAIAGYGVEGEQNYNYFSALGHEVTIVDEREQPAHQLPEGVSTILGPGVFTQLNGFDLVIRTAGLAPYKIVTDSKVWSATNEFFAQCPVPIIGVTGTKGKGTTSSLIASILRAAGYTVHLVGNIGMPALSVVDSIRDGDVVVYELSSFQLWDVERSPQIAVVLPVEPDHLDVHRDFEDYLSAKANIRRFQTADDSCIYHPTDENARRIATIPLESLPVGSLEVSSRYAIREDGQVYIKEDYFWAADRKLCSVESLVLPGKHNQENACAAMSAVLAFDMNVKNDAFSEGLQSFTGLPHRLKFVAEKAGVRYYDDSIATTPGSAIAAMRSFTEPKVLILGGSDKGAHYDEVVEAAQQTGTRILAIGQTGEKIAALCHEFEVQVEREVGLMPAVVARVSEIAKPGDIVILSPASASFDQYKNYADRGEQFIDQVGRLS